MKYVKSEDGKYLIKLEPGDKIMTSLVSFAEELNLNSGFITGIGAIKDPEIGYFDLQSKNYLQKKLSGDFELLSLNGNLSSKEEKPFFHIHIIVGDEKMNTYGGHLMDAVVSVTGEFILTPMEYNLTRSYNEALSLWLWNL